MRFAAVWIRLIWVLLLTKLSYLLISLLHGLDLEDVDLKPIAGQESFRAVATVKRCWMCYTSFTRSSKHRANVEQRSSQLIEPALSCKRGIMLLCGPPMTGFFMTSMLRVDFFYETVLSGTSVVARACRNFFHFIVGFFPLMP